MLLVLFAVMLISQAVEKGASSTEFDGLVCLYFVKKSGDIMCSFANLGNYSWFNAGSCSLGCMLDNRFVRLPNGTCSKTGTLSCKPEVLEKLVKWKWDLEEMVKPKI
uniref:Putative ixodes 10 kDa peptide protein n=1 Tax=Ixodes ricinus TaxID=34613 RepID=A0A0K8R4S6_IXORI